VGKNEQLREKPIAPLSYAPTISRRESTAEPTSRNIKTLLLKILQAAGT
jgi:hypothetical protein